MLIIVLLKKMSIRFFFFWSVMCIMVTCTETTFNDAGKVRRSTIVFF